MCLMPKNTVHTLQMRKLCEQKASFAETYFFVGMARIKNTGKCSEVPDFGGAKALVFFTWTFASVGPLITNH